MMKRSIVLCKSILINRLIDMVALSCASTSLRVLLSCRVFRGAVVDTSWRAGIPRSRADTDIVLHATAQGTTSELLLCRGGRFFSAYDVLVFSSPAEDVWTTARLVAVCLLAAGTAIAKARSQNLGASTPTTAGFQGRVSHSLFLSFVPSLFLAYPAPTPANIGKSQG